MKITLAALVLTLSLTTTAFAQNSVNLKIGAEEILTLKKIADNKYEKISDNVIGNISLSVDANGTKQTLVNQAINDSNARNDFTLELTGKNIVRVTDLKEAINQEVQANIQKTFFGKLKTISIDSKTMEALYAASLQKAGIDVLKNLNINQGAGTLTSKINSSSLECNADGDLLVCNQTQELDLIITEKN